MQDLEWTGERADGTGYVVVANGMVVERGTYDERGQEQGAEGEGCSGQQVPQADGGGDGKGGGRLSEAEAARPSLRTVCAFAGKSLCKLASTDPNLVTDGELRREARRVVDSLLDELDASRRSSPVKEPGFVEDNLNLAEAWAWRNADMQLKRCSAMHECAEAIGRSMRLLGYTNVLEGVLDLLGHDKALDMICEVRERAGEDAQRRSCDSQGR